MDGPAPDGQHRMPGWVRGFVVAGVVALVLIVVGLFAGGDHGPGRHGAGTGTDTDVPSDHGSPGETGHG